jgi:hypothetical protein
MVRQGSKMKCPPRLNKFRNTISLNSLSAQGADIFGLIDRAARHGERAAGTRRSAARQTILAAGQLSAMTIFAAGFRRRANEGFLSELPVLSS